jgi:hypothetical protein
VQKEQDKDISRNDSLRRAHEGLIQRRSQDNVSYSCRGTREIRFMIKASLEAQLEEDV